MPYKGGDLDLRSAGPTFGEPWGRPAAESNPIAADELVLACCNRAYDVARFHDSADVRLDHLLHALTHVPAAAQVLAELGIRADALRRETAVAIAADTPAAPADRTNGPRVSAALSDVLRRAADAASARHVPASIHDLLRVLLSGGPGSPAAHLLTRTAIDPQRLERWRDETRRDAFVPAVAGAQNGLLAAPDAVLERLGQLDAALRALREDMASERRAMGELLRAMQTELLAFRGSNAGAASGADPALEAKLAEFGRAMATLAGRLTAVDKLAASDNWQALTARLEAVEGRIGAQTTELSAALFQRLQEEAERHWQARDAQHVALEATVRDQLRKAEEEGKAREHELQEIHEAVAQLGTGQQLLADNLASWRAENGGDTAIVSNRLERLEQNMLDVLDRFGGTAQAPRPEAQEEQPRRRIGFKRWLYGTRNVLPGSWRGELGSIRRTFAKSRDGEKS